MNETAAEKRAERDWARDYLREHCAGRTFYTLTDYGSGETDYVRVFVAPRADEINDVSYYVARAAERRVTPRGIVYRGGQYSKGLEAADDASRAANGRPLDQTNEWTEIH